MEGVRLHRFALLFAIAVVIVSCGGSGDGAENAETGGSENLPDPCTLLDDETLLGYFSEAPVPEPGNSGPVQHCTWRDTNANSVLVQVDERDSVLRPDTCPECIDLSYGDDGYATAALLQATVTFVDGGTFYSVTTTGLGDDAEQIAALGEKVLEAAKG